LGVTDKEEAEFEVVHISEALSSTSEHVDFVVNSLKRSGANWIVIVVENLLHMRIGDDLDFIC
jgi:hypothetical protein